MNSKRNWDVKIDEHVYKELARIPRQYANRIVAIIEHPQFDPFDGDIQKIKGEQHMWRRRIGQYRMFYEVHTAQRVVHVFHVERRTSGTY